MMCVICRRDARGYGFAPRYIRVDAPDSKQCSRRCQNITARLGSDELTEWMAFYQLEPFGEMRADLRSGVVAATFANAHRTKDARAFTPEDFMPYIERTAPKDDARLEHLQCLLVI